MADVLDRALFRPADIAGAVANYLLGEASGSRADSSGNGNTLTDNNTVTSQLDNYWEDGENSADFEASNSEFLNIVNASQTGLNITGALSLVGWIKPETAGGETFIVERLSSNQGYSVFISSIGPRIRVRINAVEFIYTSGGIVSINKWTHFAVVYDQTNLIIYIDGNIVTVQAHAVDPISNTADFVLGARSTGSNPFDGLEKDMAVYDFALTPLQVKSLALGQDLSAFTIRPDSSGITTPTAYWKLNEPLASGTRLDSIGGHTLTDNNSNIATRSGYIEGAAPNFTGAASKHLDTPDSGDFDLSGGNFSVGGWLRMNTNAANDYSLLSMGDSASAFFELTRTSTRRLRMKVDSPARVNVLSLTQLEQNTWYHVMFTEAGDTWKIYLDGKDDTDTGGTDTSRMINFAGELRLGGTFEGNQALDGRMADWALWRTTTLTDTEIQQLATGLDMNDEAFVGYWKMNEVSGTRVDVINGNDLTDNNTVLFAAGKVGNAADFERDNSESLSITDASQVELDILDRLTVIAWVNRESTVAATVVNKATTGVGTGYALRINGAGDITLHREGSNVTAVSTGFGNATFFHVGGTNNGATSRLYLDAKEVGSGVSSNTLTDTAQDFIVGTDDDAGPAPWDGLIDELLVAKRDIREEELKAIYLKGVHGLEATNSDQAPAVTTDIENRGLFLVYPA